MRQSIGMSQQLNLIIIFILIVFGLIAASLSYYKAFKINNVITDSIEKYEGYNSLSEKEIDNKLSALGYQRIYDCRSQIGADSSSVVETSGFCIKYENVEKSGKVSSYSYKVTTYMTIDLPIISIIKIPVRTSTSNIPCLGNNICK